VRITLIASEQLVAELVMSQTYRINSGGLEIADGSGWWSTADPTKVFASPFESSNVGDDSESDRVQTKQPATVAPSVIAVLLLLIIITGTAIFAGW
jgi:hypothetical protein